MITLKQIGEKALEKKYSVYVGFIDLEMIYDRVNREALYVFLQMAERQCYGRRKRELRLGLYRYTTSEACLVLGR